MRKISNSERRIRLGVSHHLARASLSVVSVSHDLGGLHSSDPATVFLSSWARVANLEPADLEQALYEDRILVRMLGMRRTLFVLPVELAPEVNAACAMGYRQSERNRLVRMLEDQEIAKDGERWLERVTQETMAALTARGEATAAELTEDIPDLGRKLSFGEGTKWAGTVGISTRILFLLATEGRILRARPRGTWISSQYRWTTTSEWLGEVIPATDPGRARAQIVRRWLAAFGPGTLTDIKWWTGWTVRDTKTALQEIGAVEVELEDGTGFVLPDDLYHEATLVPWAALLPSLDPTVMGWKQREWYLGPHQRALFDRNGNAGPTVWANGRVVGGWGQRSDSEVVVTLLEKVGSETSDLIDAQADRLAGWLGDVKITPRFRTPLEREIRSS